VGAEDANEAREVRPRRGQLVMLVAALRGRHAGEGHEGRGLVRCALTVALAAILVIVAMLSLRGQIARFSRVRNARSSGGGPPAVGRPWRASRRRVARAHARRRSLRLPGGGR
jgi:hypothetical protein